MRELAEETKGLCPGTRTAEGPTGAGEGTGSSRGAADVTHHRAPFRPEKWSVRHIWTFTEGDAGKEPGKGSPGFLRRPGRWTQGLPPCPRSDTEPG